MKNNDKKRIEKKYFVPNGITIFNMFLGYLSIVESFNGNYVRAAWIIVIAMFADVLDGKAARSLNAFSEFGKELDSFCDAVSFGLAPSFLIYNLMKLYNAPKNIILPVAFMFAACGVLRLVKFNVVTVASSKKEDFSGMPIPSAACLVVSYFLFTTTVLTNCFNYYVFAIIAVVAALLMVSTVPFKTIGSSFGNMNKSFIMLFFIVAISFIKYSLFPVIVLYTLVNIYNYVYDRYIPGYTEENLENIDDSVEN